MSHQPGSPRNNSDEAGQYDTGWFKLSRRMFESTIWEESPETRILWITMIGLASSLEGPRNGQVFIAERALARRANLTLEQVTSGLKTLLSPDKSSRTSDDDGKRLRRIQGGFELVNFRKYYISWIRSEARSNPNKRKQSPNLDINTEEPTRNKEQSPTETETETEKRTSVTPLRSVTGSTPLRSVEPHDLLEDSQVLGENETDPLQEKAVSRELIERGQEMGAGPDEGAPVLVPEVVSTPEHRGRGGRRRKKRGEGPAGPPAPNYVSDACDDWTELLGGTAPGGRIGSALLRLCVKLQQEVPELEGATEAEIFARIRPVWRFYLRSEKSDYLSAQGFADKFGLWAQRMAGREDPDRGAGAEKLSPTTRGILLFLGKGEQGLL